MPGLPGGAYPGQVLFPVAESTSTTTITVTQAVAEVLARLATPPLRVTQAAVEVLSGNTLALAAVSGIRVGTSATLTFANVLLSASATIRVSASATLTRYTVNVAASAGLRVGSTATLSLLVPAGTIRATQTVAETFGAVGPLVARTTQAALEAFGADSPHLARVTQTVLEVFGRAPEFLYTRDPEVGLTWVEFTDATGTTHVWSDVALPDPASYYYGYKDNRVTHWGSIRRSLSDDQGEYVGSEFRWTVSDADRAVRALLADPATRAFANRWITVRSLPDEARRRLERPRDVYVGIVRTYQPSSPLAFDFVARDAFDALFSVTGDQRFPRRTITTEDFPQCDGSFTVPGDPDATPPTEDRDVPIGALGLPVPIIYGTIQDADGELGDGQCPAILVGVVTLSDGEYYQWVVAGHACQAVSAVYVNNNLEDLADWKVPGTPAWSAEFPHAHYEDINGRRYTTVYGKRGALGPDTAAGALPAANAYAVPFSLTVSGIETHADGTGDLITDAFLQYRHCLQNWIIGDYQAGAWLTTPVMPGPDALPLMDDGSFDRARTIAFARIGGGYRGDFILGWTAVGPNRSRIGGDRVTARDLLQRFNQSFDCQVGFNRRSQFMVSLSDDDATPTTVLTDMVDTVKDSLVITDQVERLWNRVPVRHTQDYFNRMSGPDAKPLVAHQDNVNWRNLLSGVAAVEDAASITAYSLDPTHPTPMVAPTQFLYMVRGKNRDIDTDAMLQGTATATDVVARFLNRHKDPPRQVELQIGQLGWNFELGDLFTLTHFAGVGATGWTDHVLRVIAQDSDPGTHLVTVTAEEVRDLAPEEE